jgi:hypothetical protein
MKTQHIHPTLSQDLNYVGHSGSAVTLCNSKDIGADNSQELE